MVSDKRRVRLGRIDLALHKGAAAVVARQQSIRGTNATATINSIIWEYGLLFGLRRAGDWRREMIEDLNVIRAADYGIGQGISGADREDLRRLADLAHRRIIGRLAMVTGV